MVRKPFIMIRHAITMVGRTLKCYMLLSVTIVLSFSLLFGYLVYMDSALYNKYKQVFSYDRNVLSLYDGDMDNQKVSAVLAQIEDMENTWYYVTYETSTQIFEYDQYRLNDGRIVFSKGASIITVPSKAWRLYQIDGSEIDITYLDKANPDEGGLKAGEALMDEVTFQMLGLDKLEVPIYNVSLTFNNNYYEDRESIVIPVQIVGTFETSISNEGIVQSLDDGCVALDYEAKIILSSEDLNPSNVPELSWRRRLYFYSETPELVDQVIERFSYTTSIKTGENTTHTVKIFNAVGVYESQNEALRNMQTEAKTKAIIAIALLLILGINLYSSFANALNDRKFEIGVKRALGATSWDIIRQFLYESILVMLVNIIVSIVLVIDIFICYKVLYESIPDQWGDFNQWIIYVTPYSVAMFAICAVTLTIVFSFIFAYQSTQVEIVQYLKAE